MLRNAVKSMTTIGFRSALRNLAKEFRIQNTHRASVKRAARIVGNDLKLNVGCGPNIKAGWVNIDLSERADLQLDIREPLPFPDNSASIVYSEHFFEHLEYPSEALRFLAESLRVLRPAGVFSVGVPDTEWPLKCYGQRDPEYFDIAHERWHPDWCNTWLHNINYHFRQGREHKYAYDFETLSRVLKEAGFVSVDKRAYDPTLDTESRSLGTLYVDAFKPDTGDTRS